MHTVLNSQRFLSQAASDQHIQELNHLQVALEPLSNGISYRIRAEMWISFTFQVQSLRRNLLFQTNSIFLFPFHIREKKIKDLEITYNLGKSYSDYIVIRI